MLFVLFVAGTIQIWAGRFTTTFLFTHQGIYRIGQAFHRQSSSLVHCSDYRYLTFVWGIITDHCIGTVTNTQPCGYYTHRQIRILLHSSYYYVTTITYMNLLQHLGTTYDICCIVPRAKYELTCTSSAPETPRAGRIAPTQTPYSRPDHATYGFGCPSRTYPGRLCWL